MKKVKVGLLLAVCLIVFSGCGQSKQGSDTDTTVESTEETTSSTTKNKHRKTKKEIENARKSRELDKAEREEEERRTEEEERKGRSAQSSQGSSTGDGVITADVPDFSSVTKADVVSKLGEPDEKINNQDDIVAMLDVEGPEVQLAIALRDAGKLDQEEARGFAFGAADIGMAMRMGLKIECYVYNDENKPNVYFEGDEIKFMSANTPFDCE